MERIEYFLDSLRQSSSSLKVFLLVNRLANCYDSFVLVFVLPEFRRAWLVEHQTSSSTRWRGCWPLKNRLWAFVVNVDCLCISKWPASTRQSLSTESIRALRLQVDQICSAVFPRCIFVSHARLHHLLQTLAFCGQLIHHLVFVLQCLLEIFDHSLFNFL